MGFTQIVFRHMVPSPEIGERIRKLSGGLQERHPRIERCRAAVEDFPAPAGVHELKVTVELRVAGSIFTASAHDLQIEPALHAVFAELDTRLRAAAAQPRVA
jgi:sigma 54 modulation/S30EA-like ribosomal protein